LETRWDEVRFREGLEIEPESGTAGVSPRLPQQYLWSRPADRQFCPLGSEIELWDFLYGFLRILKPNICVETGCYWGWTSHIIGCALQDNRFGHLDTCDSVAECAEKTRIRCAGLPVTVHPGRASDIVHIIDTADFLFSDSDPDSRRMEVEHLKSGAIAVVHDTHVYPWLGEMCKDMGGLTFDTPRGFGILRIP
jgi:hypothetical protein